jgi:hypothetical protein
VIDTTVTSLISRGGIGKIKGVEWRKTDKEKGLSNVLEE